nr:hypothetical protein [Bacteroidota bacterium]
MQEWWETLSSFEQLFWYIAIPFSVILLIQMVLTFVGLGSEGATDAGGGISDASGLDPDTGTDLQMDLDSDANLPDHSSFSAIEVPQFSVFTFRNFVAFFAVFGWAGIAGIHYDFSTIWVILFAAICGLTTMLIISSLFYFISKLADSGNMDIRNAINQVGNVYIPIKGNAGNVGKIQVNIQDSNREMRAITNHQEDLPTGTVVRVTGIVSGDILVVEKFIK